MVKEDRIQTNLVELQNAMRKITQTDLESLGQFLIESERVFVEGKGRTGLVMRMFAMRLMQIGLNAFVVGETTTPAIQSGDVLVVGSASGVTGGSVLTAKKAHEVGARIVTLTTVESSPLNQLADKVLILPGESQKSGHALKSKLPLGTLFEQCLLVVLDSLSTQLAEDLQQDTASMMERHSNLE